MARNARIRLPCHDHHVPSLFNLLTSPAFRASNQNIQELKLYAGTPSFNV